MERHPATAELRLAITADSANAASLRLRLGLALLAAEWPVKAIVAPEALTRPDRAIRLRDDRRR